MGSQNETTGVVENDTTAFAESLIQVMGPRAAFETCMTSQWFDVAEQIYQLSLASQEELGPKRSD